MMILIRLYLLVSLSEGAPLNPKVDEGTIKENLVIDEHASGEIVKTEDILQDDDRDERVVLNGGDVSIGEMSFSGDHANIKVASFIIEDIHEDANPTFNGGDVSISEMSFSGDHANIKTASLILEDILHDPNPTFKDDSCNSLEDCYAPGKMCHQIADTSCICKSKQCKFSSGCGTQGAFFFTPCDTCSTEDCEDEGACVTKGAQCT